MKTTINKALIILLSGIFLIAAPVYADELGIDYPHCSTYDIGCPSCHYMFDGSWPEWVTHEPEDIDDTSYNNLCWSCHTSVEAPFAKAHSSECRTCHWPHHQKQLRTYGADSYVYTAESTSITFDTLTKSGVSWTDDQYLGYILIPNLEKLSYNYKITGNTSDTLTIDVDTTDDYNGYMKRIEDFEGGDLTTNFPWSTGEVAVWAIQDATYHGASGHAAEAPKSLVNQTSHLEVQLKITGAGNISFYYKVSSDDDDYLRFLIDGEEQDRWSGDVGWTQGIYPVSVSPHIFKWEYKEGSAESGEDDTAWIDDITFVRETVTDGDTFAIIYGKLIKSTLSTPNSGKKTVKFFDPTADNSFADDDDSTYDGVCEVCHTETTCFRNDGSVPADHDEQAGANCMNCHSHDNGFVHGGGGGGGCGVAGCHDGTTGSHATHTQSNTKGPATLMACGDCHDTDNYPKFGDPGDEDTLPETDVCNPCHSQAGTYNGVIDYPIEDPISIGAKDNWDEVYNIAGDALLAGQEKWCIGCHDGGTSVIGDANAPNIELYYTGGHGREGANIKCLVCHDTNQPHIDGEARTYAFNSTYYAPAQSGVAYAEGYRLRYVDGNVPLMIPANYGTTFSYNAALMRDTAFRLCFDCHDEDNILDDTPGDGINSNFKASLPNPPRNYSYAWGSGADVNEHVAHLMNYVGPFCDSDWDMVTEGPGGSNGCDSLTACSMCHNVHGSDGIYGSTNEPMIRDGSLAGRTGYGFSYVVEDGAYPQVTSTGATQANSVGSIFRSNTSNMCGGSMCHGSPAPPPASSYDATGSSWGTYLEYYRPYQDY